MSNKRNAETTEARKHPLQATADAFSARVRGANMAALAYMSLSLDRAEEKDAQVSKIEKDIEHAGRSFSLIFLDEINHVAVVEDRTAARTGEYKYVAALYNEKLDRWFTASSYWHKVELAYMQGIADKSLGPNNQFVLFAERMLTSITEVC